MMVSADHETFFPGGRLVNYYQPVVNLQSGAVLGFEILTRLMRGPTIIPPGMFLSNLDEAELETLLFASLRRGLRLLASVADTHPDVFVSVNVTPSVMLRPGFSGTLLDMLEISGIAMNRLTLEILENDEFLSLPAARSILGNLHGHGICIALDDVGTAYSSLNRLRELPMVRKIKLDQSFIRGIEAEPAGLHFVAALISLARSLHDELIVEGVETPAILQALTVLGVEGAQGFAIARPMPAGNVAQFLAAWHPGQGNRAPQTLLDAYAAHLNIVESCRALMNQPLPFTWSKTARDPHACAIGRFFDRAGLHETEFGQAHKRFHAVIDQYQTNRDVWETNSFEMWRGLQHAIEAGNARDRIGSSVRSMPQHRVQDPACLCELADLGQGSGTQPIACSA